MENRNSTSVLEDLERQRWEVFYSREKAHKKHGENSIECLPAYDVRWLTVLVEEVGEVAHSLTYDSGEGIRELRCELIDVMSVVSAWISAIDRAEH